MRAAVQRAEAELRLRNTEQLRKRVYRQIRANVEAGRWTAYEGMQAAREFWDARLRDKRIARGETSTLSSAPISTRRPMLTEAK